jgi:hypothetical protein
MIRLPFISSVVFLSIAACGSRSPVDANARHTAALPEVNAPAPSASGEPHGATTAAKADPQPAAAIPASLQGRWGLAPRDCMEPGPGATGLLVLTADQLQFNRSHAVPATEVNSDAYSIIGNFAFTGEGRSWTKYEALKVDNRRLTRTEINPTASFSYAKCS